MLSTMYQDGPLVTRCVVDLFFMKYPANTLKYPYILYAALYTAGCGFHVGCSKGCRHRSKFKVMMFTQ